MLQRLAVGLAAIILSSSLLLGQAAAPGDGKTDADSVSASVLAALKQLNGSNDNTVASRVTLARVAIEHNAWEAARDVLADAARLDPGNAEVKDLMQQVVKNLPPPPPPTTKPSTPPPVKVPGPATKPAPDGFSAKRQVTPNEINRIRQLELHAGEMPPPVVRIDADTKKKFLAASTDVTAADFNKMTADAQAALILASGKEDLYKGVQIKTDPASIKDFKAAVDRIVAQNCASCHSGNKAGSFSLYTDKGDAAVYTNFVVLQDYASVVGGVQRLVVDRGNPEGSLLAQFMLPAGVADVPHPNVPGFKAPARTAEDTRYQQILKWLKSLDPIAPKYGIDLSKPDAPAKPAAKGG